MATLLSGLQIALTGGPSSLPASSSPRPATSPHAPPARAWPAPSCCLASLRLRGPRPGQAPSGHRACGSHGQGFRCYGCAFPLRELSSVNAIWDASRVFSTSARCWKNSQLALLLAVAGTDARLFVPRRSTPEAPPCALRPRAGLPADERVRPAADRKRSRRRLREMEGRGQSHVSPIKILFMCPCDRSICETHIYSRVSPQISEQAVPTFPEGREPGPQRG